MHANYLPDLQYVRDCISLGLSRPSYDMLELLMLTFPIDKATWRGCGQHVPTVMDKIPEDQRCTCEPKVEKEGKKYPPTPQQS